MIAAEFKTAVSTVRIHDEYCEIPADHRISHLSHIISASYKRRQLSNSRGTCSLEIAAANIPISVLES